MSAAWDEIKELHRQTTLGAKEGLAFRIFSRPVASFVLYFIKDGRITPNQVTILSLIVGIGGFCVQAAWLSYWGLVLGAVLFMIAHMLDALDGQLARHRKAGSTVGMHFDFFVDELKAYFVFLSIAIRLYQQSLAGDGVGFIEPMVERFGPHSIILGALAGITGLAIGISCTQFLKLDSWKETFPAGEGGSKKSLIAQLVSLAEKAGRFVVDYPSYILLVCVINHVEIYYAIYALVVCVYATRALLGITTKLWRINPYDK